MIGLLDVMAVRASGDPASAVVECGEGERIRAEVACDILVVGGGTGGIAAALAAARAAAGQSAGPQVCVIEETDWIGGQLTAQGVSALDEHERVSLGFLHWLQTGAPRPGAPPGFPEFKPRPDLFGTRDALGKHPYIRECRRIRALRTVVEPEVSAASQDGARAAHFPDSVGVGWYPIDIHNAGADDVGVSCRTKPFQIPMGTLIPVRIRNLLAGAKNLGTTHITNGCYRLHPQDPAAIHADVGLRRELQYRLVTDGVPLYWFIDVGVDHPAFAAPQLAAMTGEAQGSPDSLEAAALPAATRRRLGL